MRYLAVIFAIISVLALRAQERHWVFLDTTLGAERIGLIECDSDGNVYVGVNSGDSSPFLISGMYQKIIKFSPQGEILWKYILSDTYPVYVGEMLYSPDKSIVIFGGDEVNGTFLRKLSLDGELLWSASLLRQTYFDIDLDPEGNIYTTGWDYMDPYRTPAFFNKYTPEGSLAWSHVYGPNLPLNFCSYGYKISVVQNRISVASACNNINELSLYQLNTDGTSIRRTTHSFPSDSLMRYQPQSIYTDRLGNCYLSAEIDSLSYRTASIINSDGLLMQIRPDGSRGWVRTYTGEDKAVIRKIVPYGENILVAGDIRSDLTQQLRAGYLALFTPEGEVVWEKRIHGGVSYTFFTDLKTDSAGYIYAGGWGSFEDKAPEDWYLIKLNRYGERVWHTHEGGQGNQRDMAFAIALPPDASAVYMGGWLTMRYTLNTYYTAAGVAKYSNSAESLPFSVSLYPNPVSDGATFLFTLPEAQEVRVELFDAAGRSVALKTYTANSGKQELDWQPGLSAGMYFFRFSAGNETVTGKWLQVGR